MPQKISRNISRSRRLRAQVSDTESKVLDLLAENEIQLAPEEINFETARPVPEPGKPYLIYMLAVIVDVLNVLEFTFVLILPIKIISFVFLIIIMAWMFGKLGGAWWKKRLFSKLWKRYIITFLIEIIPIVAIIPATTFFVLIAHHHEKKIVILFNKTLEMMKGNIEFR